MVLSDFVFLSLMMLFCIFLGFFIRPIFFHDGTFEMDSSDPEKDIWRLVLDIDLEDVPKQKYIILKVDPNAHLSGGRIDEQF